MATSEEAHRLNQRINSASENLGIPVQRLRNRIVFQRMLARLSGAPAWVLKGGFSLEMRLGLREPTWQPRATRFKAIFLWFAVSALCARSLIEECYRRPPSPAGTWKPVSVYRL
jgi:hypothetical protein